MGNYTPTPPPSTDLRAMSEYVHREFRRVGSTFADLGTDRTAREIAAGIVPIDKSYRELESPRYASLADCLAVLGSTSTLRSGRARILGIHTLSATQVIDRKNGIIEGEGIGSETAGTGTVLASAAGLAGSPVLEIKRCQGLVMRGLRIKGDSANKPSAAILLTSTAGDSPFNTDMHFDQIHIGSNGGFDDDNATQFTDGFVVDGTNTQGDQTLVTHLHVEGVTNSCFALNQAQNVLWTLVKPFFNSAKYGLTCGTRSVTVVSPFCQTLSEADWYLPADSTLTVINSGSELGGRLCKAVDGFRLTFLGGYWQARTASVTSNGRIVEVVSSTQGSITIEDFDFTTEGGYSGPALILYLRCAKGFIRLKNVTLPTTIDAFLDIATASAGHTRRLILENVTDSTGAQFNGNVFWKHGDVAPTFSLLTGQQERVLLTGSGTWDIGNTANGANEQKDFTVTGARLGDSVSYVGKTLGLPGWNLNGEVTGSDTVRVTARNDTGGASDPASMTVYLEVKQRNS